MATHGSTLLAGQTAAAVLAFALALVLARELGADGYGRFALIVATVTIVSQIIDVRVWEAATRYASEHLARGQRMQARAVLELAVAVNLLGGLVATGVLVLLAGPVAGGLLREGGLSDAVLIYAGVAPFLALQNASAVVFRVFDRFGQLAVLTTVSPALRLAFALTVLIAGGGLVAVLTALLAAEAVASLIFVVIAYRALTRTLPATTGIAERLRVIRRDFASMGKFLAVSNLTGSLRLANEQLDVVLVGALGSPAAAGLLKLARTFVQPLTLAYKPFYEAIYPKLSRARAGGRLPDAWAVIGRMTRLAAATLLPVAAAISLASPWLIPALAGDAFAAAYGVVIPLALGTALVGTLFWLHPAALAIDLQGRALGALATASGVQVLVTVLLVPELGAVGAGVAYALFAVTWSAVLLPPVSRRIIEPARASEAEPSTDVAMSPLPEQRVIVIGPTPPPYHGVAVMTERLVGTLRRSGLLAAHLDTRDPRPLSTIGRFDWTNLSLGLRHAARLLALLARHRGAAVYLPISQGRWGFLRDAVFLITARIARRRRIVHLNGGYFATFRATAGPVLRAAMRASLGGVEQAWVPTGGLRGMFDGLVPRGRVRVLENAVDDPLTFSSDGRPKPSPDGQLRILYLSNLLPEKGCLDLIEAIERGSNGGGLSRLRVRLVGEATDEVRREIEQHARRLASRNISLELAGCRTGAAKLDEYRRADLFVFPTRYCYEGQPLVLLEAMAAGLPIITTPLGGTLDTVEDGHSAVIVPPEDGERLTDALRRVARDAGLRRRLGEAARTRYAARYTPPRFAEQVARLLTEGAGERG